MTPESAVDIFREAIMLVIMLVSIMVVPALMVGLVISIFQAATQINEQTLSFLPRLITTLSMLVIFGPFLLSEIMSFIQTLVRNIPSMLG